MEADMAGKRYYWLKLKRDFFKRHDIRILEGMPNGHEAVLFYLKLLCESVDHDGALRFSEAIPYTAEMLASVTDTDKEVANNTLVTLEQLGLLSVDEDGTIHMSNAMNMVGSAADNDNANRQRRYREKTAGVTQPLQNVTDTVTKRNYRIEKEKEKEKEKELELEKEKEEGVAPAAATRARSTRSIFKKPTVEEVKEYCSERNNGIDAQAFVDFYESKGWKVGNTPMKDWKAAVRTWEKRRNAQPLAPVAKKEILTMNETCKEERTGKWDGKSILPDWQKQKLSPEERDRYDKWVLMNLLEED